MTKPAKEKQTKAKKTQPQKDPNAMLDYEEHVAAVASAAADQVVALVTSGQALTDARITVMRSLWNTMARRQHGDVVDGGADAVEEVFAPLFRHDQWLAPEDLGFVYEQLLRAGKDGTRAKQGSYYSPRRITRTVVAEALRPHLPRLMMMTTEDFLSFSVHDPACGGGAMLIEATRQLAEHLYQLWIHDRFEWPEVEPGCIPDRAYACHLIARHCISGTDIDPAACEVTRLALRALGRDWESDSYDFDIWPADALLSRPIFAPNVVVMNPPYLGGGKISTVLGAAYLKQLQGLYGVAGRADLSSYFLRAYYEQLPLHGTIGIVATNTISQGDTREFGLGRIVRGGGVIYHAQTDLDWPGDANVVVSIAHIQKLDLDTTPVPESFWVRRPLEEARQRWRAVEDVILAEMHRISSAIENGENPTDLDQGNKSIPLQALYVRLQSRVPDLTTEEFTDAWDSLVESGRIRPCIPTPSPKRHSDIRQLSLLDERGAA